MANRARASGHLGLLSGEDKVNAGTLSEYRVLPVPLALLELDALADIVGADEMECTTV